MPREYKPPRYVRWMRAVNDSPHSLVSDTAAEVANTLLDVAAMQRGTAGNFNEMDIWIDAQLDKMIAVCGGNERLALFQAMIGMGFALDVVAKMIAKEDG